jgi:hypothetical protein
MRRARKLVVALGVTAAVVAAAAVWFDRTVRARVAAEAERRGLEVAITKVRPAWRAVRLVGVRARLRGVDAIEVALDEVRVEVDGAHARSVAVHGGGIDVRGTRDEVVEAVRAWRAKPSSDGAASARMPIAIDALVLRWPTIGVDARGVSARREANGAMTVDAAAASLVTDAATIRTESAHAAFESGALHSITAARAAIEYAPALAHASPALPRASGPAHAPALTPRAFHGRILTLAARALSLPRDVTVSIDALSLAPRDGDGLALGPGAFTASRDDTHATFAFTTRTKAAPTPLTLRAKLPLDATSEARITLDGGPVTFANLGIADGTFGLGDLDRATLAGKADITLSSSALVFDVDLAARDLALTQRRLANGTLRGLRVAVRARGSLDDDALRIDDADLAMDRAHVLVRGRVDLATSRAGASLAFEVPRTECQALLESAPAALAPTVQGLRFDGALAARARIAFTLAKARDATLDWTVDSTCTVNTVPPHLARERFKRPFQHKLYSAHGEVREETLGPGTPSWTPLGAMSRFLPIAVVMTEDGGFFRRDGFNRAQIQYAFATDLAEHRFARG